MIPIEKMKAKPVFRFTAERKEHYLELLRKHPQLKGCRALCAEAVGTTLSTVNVHLKRDPVFAEAHEDAIQAFIDENLYAKAVERAANGVERPIIGGKDRDQVVATERVYSDALMIAMLRAHRMEFREKADGGGGSSGWTPAGGNGVMVIPSAPTTIADWQEHFGELAQGTHGREAGS